MFQFNRRTLWIIIFVTIPLIIFLDSLGRNDNSEAVDSTASSERLWSMDDLAIEQRGSLLWLDLPTSNELRISIISDMQPSQPLEFSNPEALQRTLQGGRFIATMANPVNAASVRSSMEFIQQWLPASANVSLVVSGPYSAAMAENIEAFVGSWQGTGQRVNVQPRPALAQLASPPWGSADQLAFLVWISILQQRLAGYSIQTSWDHQGSPSIVSFNSTLAPDVFTVVSNAEFQPVLAAYVQSANRRERSQQQLHRYLVTAEVYSLSMDYFIGQPARLAALTLQQINAMREFSRAQIQR